MDSEVTAGVLGAAIGLAGAVLGAVVNGGSQRAIANRQRIDAQRAAERVASASFLACLDVYVVAAEELRWAKKEASRKGNDIGSMIAEPKVQYRTAWFAFLTASAELHLAAGSDLTHEATKIVNCAKIVDNLRWNYIDHGGERIAGEYQSKLSELEALREKFVLAAQQPAPDSSRR